MPSWESPLRPGDIVECQGGFRCQIREIRESDDVFWRVKALVLSGHSGNVGRTFWMSHTGPDRFVDLTFLSINGVPIHQFLSPRRECDLEEEFFSRASNA